MEESSEIQSFYKSNNVLITGGTGFLGRVLIEKLLRSTEVSTVYVLIRPKKGKCVNRRFDELFECEIFDRLKRECPKFEHRVKAVPGDCSMSGLGLSITDRQTMISEINVVFHVAATVKFDENLKRALNINVNGTKDLLQLAEQMVNLKSLIHVSTAYSNCPLKQIDEVFYKFPYSYEDVVTIIEKLSEYEAAELTTRIIGEWPNTYTFTKALAESLIKDIGGGLPIGIFRPGVVISTYREPMPGWTDHLNGPGGVAAAAISGVMRTLMCGRTNVADLVPVDACVAGLVAAAWDVANRNEGAHRERQSVEESIPIYNYVSSTENPITWYEFTHYTLSYGNKYPIRNAKWVPFMILTPNSLLYFFLTMLLHILPGLLIDAFLVLFGKKPKMLRVYKKIHKLSNIISYFCIRNWSFTNCNTAKLWKKLNRVDRDLFPMSMTTVHWLIYMRNYIKGVRTYLLKDPDSTLHVAKKRNNLLNILSNILKIIFILSICSIFPLVLTQFTSYIL